MSHMDIVHETVDDESMDTEEYLEGSTFVGSSPATLDGSTDGRNEENSESGVGKNGENTNSIQETSPEQEPSSVLDPDELEMEEDDITSKLLSIQVLPRIPKRKPVTDNSATTSAAETSSYYSVLERVNSAPGHDGAKYSNWSAAGWSRSNVDRLPKQASVLSRGNWSRRNIKDEKGESKPNKRTTSEQHTNNDVKRRTEVPGNKTKHPTEHSAWSPDATDVSNCPSFSEIEQIASSEDAAPSLTGPLPTLPFEEQMRERARLRNLKKQGSCLDDVNNSSESADTVLKNVDNTNSSKVCFNLASAPGFLSDKTDTGKPVVNQRQHDANTSHSADGSAVLHRKSTERHHRRLSQHSLSENGHSHVHRSNKTTHRTSGTSAEENASRHSPVTGIQNAKPAKSGSDKPMPKPKKEPSSPPLPHLPVLPLFATSVSETGKSSLLPLKPKTTVSGKKTTTLSSPGRNTSTKNDNVRNISKLKPAVSHAAANTTSSKSVTFNSDTKSQDGTGTKKKSKTKVG